jgi:glycosyltransferase involved in cell wall biosynthesis
VSPVVSVFLPSYNKAPYVTEAVSSILAQDYGDFEFWILENSTDDGPTREALAPLLADKRIRYEEIGFTPAERANSYIPSVLLNRYYPQAAGEFIFYLSDDDLLAPSTFRLATGALQDPRRMVCWWSMEILGRSPQGWGQAGAIQAHADAGAGSGIPVVDCRIDGGQVAYRKRCLDEIDPPWFPEEAHQSIACHSDGVFLQKLADRWTFHPVPELLLTHRMTELSTWATSGVLWTSGCGRSR